MTTSGLFCNNGFGPGPSRGIAPNHVGERIHGGQHEPEEERRNHEAGDHGPAEQRVIGPLAEPMAPQRCRRQHQAPQQDEPWSADHMPVTKNKSGV